MFLFHRPWIWLLRFRKRKGYGVHSPWAFSFITNVIYEKTSFYAYKDLKKQHTCWVKWGRFYPVKCRRMLFRVANFFHPETILCLGECEIEQAYFQQAVPSAKVYFDTPLPNVQNEGCLIFVKSSHLATVTPEWLQTLPHGNKCCLILEGIHSNKKHYSHWKQLQNDPLTGITFDLYTYGIICFDHTLHKQHYKVNF